MGETLGPDANLSELVTYDRGTDPAVEAAQRAMEPSEFTLPTKLEIAAAREALKPIRVLHYRRPDLYAKTVQVCDSCLISWPCATAKLIYTTEELER